MIHPLNIIVFGLSLTSSWGNGHATTYRSLIRGLSAQGHRVLFLERDVPWYAGHRDLPDPDFCDVVLYRDTNTVVSDFRSELENADAVIVGSYVQEGVHLIDALTTRPLKHLCFYDIDTPVTLAKLGRGDEEYLARRQIPGFDIYFSFSGGEVLRQLEDEWGARRAEALHCSVDADRYRPTGGEPVWDLGYLGTYSPDRQPVLERLLLRPARILPQMRFVVAGPQYPSSIDWPDNVERIDHLPPADHPAFYSRQRFTLNVTRADMVAAGWSPSVRLFEAAACGTPIISDRWRGLGELLPDREAIFLADDAGDVYDALTAEPGAFDRMGARARQIVLASHTGDARATQLADMVRTAPSRSWAASTGLVAHG